MPKNFNNWRDQQVKNFAISKDSNCLLFQESLLVDFLAKVKSAKWKWLGDHNGLMDFCIQNFNIVDSDEYNGIILFGLSLRQKSTAELATVIRNQIKDIKYAYVGLNRYEIGMHDAPFDLPDCLGESIDALMYYIDPHFKRIFTHPTVDGNHMVAAHPMDCYTLCK